MSSYEYSVAEVYQINCILGLTSLITLTKLTISILLWMTIKFTPFGVAWGGGLVTVGNLNGPKEGCIMM
jgi:hypothetical protein